MKILFPLVNCEFVYFNSLTFIKDVIMYCIIIIDVILRVHTAYKTQMKVQLDIVICL